MMNLKTMLSGCECPKQVSMFRKFTNAIAGTGAVFAFLHVFFGYMGFDKTPNATTGEVPSFLDVAEYRYYIVLLLFFTLTPVVSGIFRRLPALALIPATVTTTYVMLLFDADVLTAGPMTFLLFSLFTFAGHVYVSLASGERVASDLYRIVMALIGVIVAVWAILIAVRMPSAPDKLLDTLKPNESLDGLSALWRYERLQALAAAEEAGNGGYYLLVAAGALLLSGLLVLLPKWKPLIAILALLVSGFLFYLVGTGRLSYYPMLLTVPLLALTVGCLVHTATELPLATPVEEKSETVNGEVAK